LDRRNIEKKSEMQKEKLGNNHNIFYKIIMFTYNIMSLSFEPISEESVKIAELEGQKKGFVYVTDSDYDFENGENSRKTSKSLEKIKLLDDKSKIFPVISDNTDGRGMCIYVTGANGVGKTYHFIRPFIIRFFRKFPSSKVYYFSSKPEDKAVDDLKIIRVKINDSFVNKLPDIRTFAPKDVLRPNLLIFDDVQDFDTSKKNKAVWTFRDQVMRNGRSLGIYTIMVWHESCDYKNTKSMIYESTACVIFPKNGGDADYEYFLDKYIGIKDLEKRKLLKRAKSKFVYITKKSPRTAISDNYIVLL
jgi:hypothetical protein